MDVSLARRTWTSTAWDRRRRRRPSRSRETRGTSTTRPGARQVHRCGDTHGLILLTAPVFCHVAQPSPLTLLLYFCFHYVRELAPSAVLSYAQARPARKSRCSNVTAVRSTSTHQCRTKYRFTASKLCLPSSLVPTGRGLRGGSSGGCCDGGPWYGHRGLRATAGFLVRRRWAQTYIRTVSGDCLFYSSP